jgi:thiamine pyrophosphate-dependent acetolactate synthase large subunit-like protein
MSGPADTRPMDTRHSNDPRLDRRVAMRTLLEGRGDLLLVTGLGSTTYDAAAVADDERNFYLWGAMGAASMVGLGLALARPERRVLVVTGDGEMLMGMGAFASVAQHEPKNLTIVVLDNEAYGETGGQATHTAYGADLTAVAKACGIADAKTLTTMVEVETFAPRCHDATAGPAVATIKIDAKEAPRALPPRDGVLLMNRTRAALGFPPF